MALRASTGPLSRAYDAGLVDLDGVLYLGPEPVPWAAESVATARADGMRIAFVTNNASRGPAAVAAHLSELGIPAVPADVVTSGQAIARALVERLPAGSTVLVIGSSDLAAEVAAAGFAVTTSADGAAAVVQGLAPGTAWTDLAEASVAIRRGALWVAGNRDSTYPSPRGPLPGNGAMVDALVTATGHQPLVVGKPEPELHQVSLERVASSRPLVVGDRLDTDILGARRAGTDSLLVLTGVTDRTELLAAPADRRPTYLASDLRGLTEGHPEVALKGDRAACREASAWYDDTGLQLSDGSDDALRAGCVLSWSRAG